MCFAPLRSPKSLELHSVLRFSYFFSHLHLLSSDSFSSTLLSSNLSLLIFLFSLPLPCSAFHLSILSEVWLLNFLRLLSLLPVVPHKAVAEVSKIGNLRERLVVVNKGWQSEATDGPKGRWGVLSFSLFLWLPTYLSIYLPIYLSVYLSIYRSICLSVYLSICGAVSFSVM